METLILAHFNGGQKVSFRIFVKILRYLSDLKTGMATQLTPEIITDFENDLLENNIKTVKIFIEQAIEIPDFHPHIYLILFEALKSFVKLKKLRRAEHQALCNKLLEKRGQDIAQKYDLERIKKNFLTI
jgi:hypothetical protein